MQYNPRLIPELGTVEELRQWLNEELKSLSQALNETDAVDLRASKHEPTRPREGMIVHADGTSWNPGGGQGTYRFQNGLWVKVVEAGDLGDFARKSQDEDITGTWRFANAAGTGGATEGAEFHMKNPATTTLAGTETVVDLNSTNLRVFENGGAFRGFFIDIATLAGGAGTDLRAVFDASNKGLVPASGGGTTNFLRADGGWAAPGGGGITLITTVSAPAATQWAITGLGGYKFLIISGRDVQQNSGTSRQLQVEVSGNNGSSYGGIHLYIGGTAIVTGTPSYPMFFITRTDQVNNQFIGGPNFTTLAGVVETGSIGPINAVRLSWSGAATNFVGGSADIYGLK